MAQLIPLHLQGPGSAGLNPRDDAGVLGPQWCSDTNNMTLSRKSRLQVRPGTRTLDNGTAPGLYGATLYSVLKQNDDAYYYFHDGSRTIYVLDRGGGMVGTNNWIALVALSGPSTTAHCDNPKFASLNDSVYCVGKTAVGGNDDTFQRQTSPSANFAHVTGAPVGCFEVLAAYGRLWAMNSFRLYWSALLDGSTWTPASDYIDLTEVFPGGADTPVGLAEYNGFLIVFGTRSIIIYQNPDQVAAGNMTKVETIKGVGLLNRDLIQDIGSDLIFMSNGGLVSLNRVIQEKSMPINLVGNHVLDAMLADFNSADYAQAACASAYDGRAGTLYMKLSSAVGGYDTYLWCLDVKHRTPEGTLPVTQIKYGDAVNDPVYFHYNSTIANYVSADPTEGGIMVSYKAASPTYYKKIGVLDSALTKDDCTYAGTGGSAIPRASYSTGWLDFSEAEAGDVTKILKEIRLLVEGGNSIDWTLTVYGDYDDSTVLYTETLTADATASSPSMIFGAAGECDVVKFKFEATSISSSVSITRVSAYAKRGKLSQ